MDKINLKSVIQSGDTIYTQCSTYDEWIPNIIVDCDNDILRINLTDYYFRKGVIIGNFISIRYTFSEKEYVLEGEVIDIDIYNTYTISIFINNINIYQNRRKFFRYYSRLGSSIKNNANEKGVYSIVTNISLSGAAVISKVNLTVGDKVLIDLFQSSESIIPLCAVVVRKKALNYGYEYGIAFRDIDENTNNQIRSLIETLETKLY